MSWFKRHLSRHWCTRHFCRYYRSAKPSPERYAVFFFRNSNHSLGESRRALFKPSCYSVSKGVLCAFFFPTEASCSPRSRFPRSQQRFFRSEKPSPESVSLEGSSDRETSIFLIAPDRCRPPGLGLSAPSAIHGFAGLPASRDSETGPCTWESGFPFRSGPAFIRISRRNIICDGFAACAERRISGLPFASFGPRSICRNGWCPQTPRHGLNWIFL